MNNNNSMQQKRRKVAKTETSIGVGDGEAKTKSLFFLDEQKKSDLTRATTNSLTVRTFFLICLLELFNLRRN